MISRTNDVRLKVDMLKAVKVAASRVAQCRLFKIAFSFLAMPIKHRTQPSLIAAFMAACLSLAFPAAQAAKPAPNAPVRQALISAIRHHPTLGPALADSTLDIRRVWASDKYGFVCLLPVSKKGRTHQQQGDAYVVHQIVLVRKQAPAAEKADQQLLQQPPQQAPTTWQAVAHIDGLSESVKRVQCASDAQGQISDEFLESVANNPSMAL